MCNGDTHLFRMSITIHILLYYKDMYNNATLGIAFHIIEKVRTLDLVR